MLVELNLWVRTIFFLNFIEEREIKVNDGNFIIVAELCLPDYPVLSLPC